MSEEKVKELGLEPQARMAACSVGGVDLYMGIGPCEAIPKALRQAGLKLADIEQTELNEAFAAQALAVIQESGSESRNGQRQRGSCSLRTSLGLYRSKAHHPAVERNETPRSKIRNGHRLCWWRTRHCEVFLNDCNLNFLTT